MVFPSKTQRTDIISRKDFPVFGGNSFLRRGVPPGPSVSAYLFTAGAKHYFLKKTR